MEDEKRTATDELANLWQIAREQQAAMEALTENDRPRFRGHVESARDLFPAAPWRRER